MISAPKHEYCTGIIPTGDGMGRHVRAVIEVDWGGLLSEALPLSKELSLLLFSCLENHSRCSNYIVPPLKKPYLLVRKPATILPRTSH
jgi:hypothetical protein